MGWHRHWHLGLLWAPESCLQYIKVHHTNMTAVCSCGFNIRVHKSSGILPYLYLATVCCGSQPHSTVSLTASQLPMALGVHSFTVAKVPTKRSYQYLASIDHGRSWNNTIAPSCIALGYPGQQKGALSGWVLLLALGCSAQRTHMLLGKNRGLASIERTMHGR